MDELPSSEITSWMAFYELEPWGSFRDNWHAATLAHMYASVHAGKGRAAPKFSSFFYIDPQVQASNERKSMMARLDALASKAKDHD